MWLGGPQSAQGKPVCMGVGGKQAWRGDTSTRLLHTPPSSSFCDSAEPRSHTHTGIKPDQKQGEGEKPGEMAEAESKKRRKKKKVGLRGKKRTPKNQTKPKQKQQQKNIFTFIKANRKSKSKRESNSEDCTNISNAQFCALSRALLRYPAEAGLKQTSKP